MIKSIYQKLKTGLQKTREGFTEKVNDLLANFRTVDEELLEELEEILIEGDIGVETTDEIIEDLRKIIKKKKITESVEVFNILKKHIQDTLGEQSTSEEEFIKIREKEKPHVILFVGINGTGKTTSIGKLANFFHERGKKTMLAAADTFRAAAVEQLEIWASRSNSGFICHRQDNADPAAVAFDAYQSAVAKGYDILLIDTAGRLHTKTNLMKELRKIYHVLNKISPSIPHEIWLVIDGNSGQNAINQTKIFQDHVPLTGLILTKLDGTAHGGVVVTISKEFKLPIILTGVGEGIDDLQIFNSEYFTNALFEN